MGHLWGGLSAIPSLGNMAGADHSNMSGIGEASGSSPKFGLVIAVLVPEEAPLPPTRH